MPLSESPVCTNPQEHDTADVGPLPATERDRLLELVELLRRERDDLQIALLTSNEHGDLLQEHLYRLIKTMGAEVRERQTAEERLQRLIAAITKEKGDL